MNLTAAHVGDVVVLRATGELDTFATAAFHEQIRAHARRQSAVVIDLGGISFIDSAGLHVLFAVGSTVRGAGGCVLYVVPPDASARVVIELVQLADVCPVCESVDEALARLPAAHAGAFDPLPEGVESAGTESSTEP